MFICNVSHRHFRVINVFFLNPFFKDLLFFHFFWLKLNPSERRKSYLSRDVITNFRSFPYLDIELLFPQVRKTGGFALLCKRRFKNKTAAKIVIKYIFKSRN